jgi:hypothetical protein
MPDLKCIRYSHVGIVRLVHFMQSKRQTLRFSPLALPHVHSFAPSPPHRRGVFYEASALVATEKTFREMITPTLKVPLVVLSHDPTAVSMFASMALEPDVDDSMVAQMEAEWSRGQNELAALSTDVVHRVVPHAGHDIPQEYPEEVVAAVLAIVNEVRGNRGAGLHSLEVTECPL